MFWRKAARQLRECRRKFFICFGLTAVDKGPHCGSNEMTERTRTGGEDLPDHIAQRILDDFVPAAQLCPKLLWACKLQPGKGHTSDWASLNKTYHILSDIIDECGGKVVKQASLRNQFFAFLSRQHVQWSFREADDAVSRIRAMLMTLQEFRRDHKASPKNYPPLQALLDKMLVVDRPTDSRPIARPLLHAPSRIQNAAAAATVFVEESDDENDAACVPVTRASEQFTVTALDELESSLFSARPMHVPRVLFGYQRKNEIIKISNTSNICS